MANVWFMRKLVKDELFDTMFFATGEQVEVVKSKDGYTMNVPGIKVVVLNGKNIKVNGITFKNSYLAKQRIQEFIM